MMEVKDWLGYFERFWENKMEALKRYVESGDAGPRSEEKGV